MKRKQVLIISGSLFGLTGLFLGYRTIKRKQVYDILVDKIKSNSITDNRAVQKALQGNYHKNLDTTKSFVKLKDIYVQQKAEKFRSAFEQTFDRNATFGLSFTDENSIYGILNGLNDKVALSQIASFYTARYNEDFKGRLEDELNPAEESKVYEIMALKPDVRWLY